MKNYLISTKSHFIIFITGDLSKKYLLLLINFLFVISSFSQTKRCDGVLIPDVTIIDDNYAFAKSIVNIFESNHIETYDDYKNFMGNATIPIEGVPWTFGSNITDQNFKEIKDNLYKYSSLSVDSKNKINQTIKSLSKASIEAWTACQNQNGFRIWLLQGADPKSFTLAAIYKGPNSVHLRNVSFDQPVTTGRGGSFCNHNLKTNKSYPYKNVVQYQTFNRTTDKAINIDVNPFEAGAGEGLHIQLAAIPNSAPPPSPTGIQIADGDIKENSKVNATWGILDVDPEAALRNTWRKMPWGGHNGPWVQSAAVETNPTVKVLVATKENYLWNLEIVNPITAYCHGGQIPLGGDGEAAPQYKTTIKLPQLNSAESYWIITLKADTYVDIDHDNSVGSAGSVTLTGEGLTKTFSFAVNRTHDSKSLKIDNIEPGNYWLELQAPVMRTACYGPPGFVKAIYTTTLSADILAHEVPIVIKTSYSLYYWIGGILLLLLLGGIIYFISKNNMNRRRG
jgi:hypothetical protein